MLQPYKPYFLVKINKEAQRNRNEKIGLLYTPTGHTFMTRNMQSGEIVAIGSEAHELFPEAQVGQLLIFHHFVEGTSQDDDLSNHLVDEDETFRYYVVTSRSHNGKGSETYGVWDGEKIIPHAEYMFLQAEPPAQNDLPPDEFINQSLKKEPGGHIFTISNFKDTRENKVEKLAQLKAEAQGLGKNVKTLDVKNAIEAKEKEMAYLSAEMNLPRYTPFKVAYVNNEVSRWFDREVKHGDILYCLNQGCQTPIEVQGKEYIVARAEFIGFMLNTEQV